MTHWTQGLVHPPTQKMLLFCIWRFQFLLTSSFIYDFLKGSYSEQHRLNASWVTTTKRTQEQSSIKNQWNRSLKWISHSQTYNLQSSALFNGSVSQPHGKDRLPPSGWGLEMSRNYNRSPGDKDQSPGRKWLLWIICCYTQFRVFSRFHPQILGFSTWNWYDGKLLLSRKAWWETVTQ